MNNTPEKVWSQYTKGKDYNTSIGLYDTVKQNENFYIGKQWEGLNAPDLDKPVVNMLGRVVSYKISQIASDDVKANFTAPADDEELDVICNVLSEEVDNVIEKNHLKNLNRESIRDCAVDGDTIMYLYANTPELKTPTDVSGIEMLEAIQVPETQIKAELLSNTNVIFGNPYDRCVEDQPYILIVQFLFVKDVQNMVSGDDKDEIKPDNEGADVNQDDNTTNDKRVTLITKFWKENDTIHYYQCTQNVEVTKETNTEQTLYPIAYMSWEKVKGSYHGQADITGHIPNQIAINKMYAMAMRQQQTMAFPKVLYNKQLIKKWSNRIGEAIPVTGNPTEAVANGFRAPDMSNQVFELINQMLTHTRDTMGASDAALGNVRPDNTSAILAVQKASSAPLEMQKIAFYQFVEDYIRVMVDIMRAKYGVTEKRTTVKQVNPMTGMAEEVDATATIDFSMIDLDKLNLKVDVGAASLWSEIGQLTTMDNLFDRGLISGELYIEGMPSEYIKNKNKILADIERNQAVQAMGGEGVVSNLDPTALQNAEQLIGGIENALPGM